MFHFCECSMSYLAMLGILRLPDVQGLHCPVLRQQPSCDYHTGEFATSIPAPSEAAGEAW
eukprot:scaffold9676_cov18-Tisochrysis_lutea.AAC.3